MTHTKPSDRSPTSQLTEALIAQLDVLLMRACEHSRRDDPVSIHDMLDLYEIAARLDLLIETLDARRRIHMDVYTSHDADKL